MDSSAPAEIKEGDLVLVTGGGGYIGSHCVYNLLEKGYRVRTTVRDPNASKNAFLKAFHPKAATNLEMVAGDLMKADGWDAALKGVDGVVHVASPFPLQDPEDEQQVIGPAVSGVEVVLNEAAKAKVKRVVLTSSAYAVFQPMKSSEIPVGKVLSEEDWSNPEVQKGYGKSKTLAEKKGWELANSLGINLVTILPGLVLGKALSKSAGKDSASNQTIQDMMSRKHPALPRCFFPAVDVADVAELHTRALTAPKDSVVGKRFLAAGEDTSLVKMSTMLHEEFAQYGFHPPTREMPTWLLRLMSWFSSDAAFALTVVSPPISVPGKRSKDVLGMKYKELRQSLKEHALSLIALGIIPPKQVPEKMYSPYKPTE